MREYEDSLKAYRDVKNSIDTALEQGLEQGRAECRAEGRAECRAEGRVEGERGMALQIARKMLSQGIDLKSVMEMTGLIEKDLN